MATWMTHFRITDKLLRDIGDLPQKQFIVGNIAPDSGEPNEDWSVFTPSKKFSHWEVEGVIAESSAEKFKEAYLDKAGGLEERAFCLGYYAHLIVDYLWHSDVYLIQKDRHKTEFAEDPRFTRKLKADWYDLDHLFLRDNPEFRTFKMFAGIKNFPNRYLDIFSEQAFEKRIEYITNFYLKDRDGLDRDYPFMKMTEMDSFVDMAVKKIRNKIKDCYKD